MHNEKLYLCVSALFTAFPVISRTATPRLVPSATDGLKRCSHHWFGQARRSSGIDCQRDSCFTHTESRCFGQVVFDGVVDGGGGDDMYVDFIKARFCIIGLTIESRSYYVYSSRFVT